MDNKNKRHIVKPVMTGFRYGIDRLADELRDYTFRLWPAAERCKTTTPIRPDCTKAEAEKKGYAPLTLPHTKGEQWMLNNVIADMRRGGVQFLIVNEPEGLTVFRKGMVDVPAEV